MIYLIVMPWGLLKKKKIHTRQDEQKEVNFILILLPVIGKRTEIKSGYTALGRGKGLERLW